MAGGQRPPRAGAARRGAWLGVACTAALLSGGARAAELSIDGSLIERLGYDDNIGLNRTDEVSDFSSESILRVDMASQTETVELGLRSRLGYTAFLDETDLDSDDQRVAAYGSYTTPLMRWGLTAAYDRDTTRTRDEDDTGEFILDNVRRQEVEVKPTWSYRVTSLDSLILRGDYSLVDFDEELVDYTRYGGEAGWAHRLNRTNEFDFFGLGSFTESEGNLNRETQVYGFQAGWNSSPLRGLDVRLAAGAYWAKTTFDPSSSRSGSFDSETSVGFLPTATIAYEIDPRTQLEASYARSIAPSGGGEVLERDIVNLAFSHDWSRRWSSGLTFTYRGQDSLEDDGRADRDFLRASPSVTWRITDSWSLNGAYRLRWQSREGQSKNALSNAVFLTLSFQPLAWRSSD